METRFAWPPGVGRLTGITDKATGGSDERRQMLTLSDTRLQVNDVSYMSGQCLCASN